MPTFKITTLSGSLRSASYSTAVLQSLPGLMPSDVDVEIRPLLIGELPHYNQDVDTPQKLPAAVAQARSQVSASDLVVIVTPEFNHGIPGVLKNTLDWLSRPAFSSCMVDKTVLFMTQSPGALGGVRAQYQLRETLASMLCRLPAMPEIVITHATSKMQDGHLTEVATRDFIARIVRGLLPEMQPVSR